MKTILNIIVIILFVCNTTESQNSYSNQNIEVLNLLKGYVVPTTTIQQVYNSCLGWYQPSKLKEYAIYSFENKLYFTNISDPGKPVVADSINLAPYGNIKRIDVSNEYCFVVLDYFTVVKYNLKYLPDSVAQPCWYYFDLLLNPQLSNSKLFEKRNSNLIVYDLTDPVFFPTGDTMRNFIKHLGDVTNFSVKNDTIYASCFSKGLYIIKYDRVQHSFSLIDSIFHSFPNIVSNYNSCVSKNNQRLCTFYEPVTLDPNFYVKQNGGNYKLESTYPLMPSTSTIIPQFVGNDWLLVSNVRDGLFVYDVSELNNIKKTGYFNTRTGTQNPNYSGIANYFSGLPSGNILALDKLKGIYILDPKNAMPLKIPEIIEPQLNYAISAFPNPSNEGFSLQLKRDFSSKMHLYDVKGVSVFQKEYSGNINDFIPTKELNEGNYILKIEGNEGQLTKKIVVIH